MQRKYVLYVASVLVLLLSLLPMAASANDVGPAIAAGPSPQIPETTPHGIYRGVSTAVKFDVSLPLREITPLAPAQAGPSEIPERGTGLEGALGPQDADAALQTSYGPSLIPAPIVSFDGPSNISGVSPPDPVGDVGPNHYVAMSNLSFQIFNKAGASLYGPALNNTLWAGFGGDCQTDNDGDPIVLYDQLSDRWMLSQFTASGPTYFNCVAISTTPDPTGSYYRYAFSNGTNFPDYPKYGFWSDALYISTRDFAGGSTFTGIGAIAINRAQLIAGNPTPSMIMFQVTPASAGGAYNLGDGLLPSDLDGSTLPPAGTPNFFMGAMDNGGPYGAPQDALTLWKFTANFTTPAASTFVLASTIPIASYDTIFPCSPTSRNCIPQPGTTNKIDILSYRQRPMHRLAYRNFGSHESLVTNQSVEAAPAMAGIRWWEIRSPNSSPVLYQDSTYAPGISDTIHRWMGSIAQDSAGNMALGYSTSNGTTTFPSVWYTGRLASDPVNTMPQGEGSIINGTGSQTGSGRWGDYTSMNVDPVDDCTFWYVNEWVPTTGTNWRLRIGAFRFPGCGGPPPIPNIDVSPLSLASTQASNTTTQQTLTIANTGGGTLNWTINEEPGSLRKPIRASRGSQPAAATRQVTIGDAGFSGSSLTPGQVVTPERPPTAPNLVTITHSASQSIITGNSVSCNAGGLHTNNSYLREFDLTAFGIGGAFGVTQVQIGVEQAIGATGNQPITVNLYTKINPAAPLTFANLAPIGSANATVTDQSLTLLTIPVAGTAPAGSVLVVEIFTPEGQTAGNSFFIGSNNLGQTAPSYLAAADCGVPEPTSTANIGFPGMHIVMNVTGDAATTDPCTNLAEVPWLSEAPTSGATAGGASTPVQVTFNSTGLAAGTYNANLCVDSNDPDPGPGNGTDLVVVPVALTVTSTAPNINVSPLSLASTQAPNTSTQQTLTVGNTGGSNLTWTISEASASLVQNPEGGAAPRPATAGTTGSRGGAAGGPAPIAYTSPADFSEDFADISTLPGLGWYFQNNSDPLGVSDWFQGNDGVFPAQAGAATAYIGANFNNTSGAGTISNWMLTPEIALANGDQVSFWTRTPDGSIWPDRLEMRLSTGGASTNVGTSATSVGDFTTVLVEVNPTLAQFVYPEVWTQFTATLSGIPAGATGRIAWRYFVTDGGPSGNNSNYIGIDTVEFTSGGPAGPCDAPSNVPWLSEVPTSGTTAGGASTPVQVTFNSTGLAAGTYNANLCVDSNDPDPGPGNGTDQVIVPVQLVVSQGANPAIELNKTVGTTPGVCAVGDNITVTAGTEVYYCYQVQNTGDVALNFHDLDDSELGEILDDLPYVLAPGTYSPQVVVPATPMATVTNVGTWTAVSALAGYAMDDTIAYNFQDISGTGTAISLSDDSVSPAIPLGFTFDYFGSNYPDVFVSSNGFLTVVDDGNSGCCTGQPIPTPGSPDGVIAGWWEDLNPGAGGTIVYQTLGSAPNRVFIVQFTNVPHYGGGNEVTMQWKLFEGSNVIEVHYQAAPSDGGTHSAGIENADGSAGLQWYLGTASLATPEAVRYAPVPVYSATDTDTATVTVLVPNIDVNPLSLSSTQPPNTSTTLPMTVANTGEGNLMWEIAEANQANGMYLPMVQPHNVPQTPVVPFSKIDGVTMSAASNGTGQTVIPERPATPDLLTITHSTSQAIVQGNSVACNAGGLHTDNSYLREFDLAAFGITGPFAVSQVEIGVEQALGATGDQPITVNLYTKINPADPLTFGNLAPIGSASVQVSDQNLTLFTAPVAGVAPAGSVLVVEIFTPNGQTAGNSFFIGSNPDPETAPSYLAAADCGVPEPTTTAAIGFPDMHIVMNVTGTGDVTGCVAPADVPWMNVTPLNGANTGGTSTPVQVTLDSTGLALGAYTANLCVTSNDPDPGPGNGTELVQVPVTLTVQGEASIAVAKTVGTAPGVCAATSTITVPMGTTVYYCYTVTNTGDVTLNSHTLVDDKLGTLFTNFAYALTPGSSVNTVQAGLSIPAVINANTTNIATWTAAQSSTGGLSATATATARVNIVTLVCNDAGENFDAAVPPLGWTVVSSIPAGPQWTTIAGCGELGNYATGNGGAACASGLNYPDGTFDTELRTPPFSLAGWTGGTLNFKLNFQSWAGMDRLSVDITNNGGATWTTVRLYDSNQGALQALPGVNVNLDLTPWAGQTNLMLRWRYYSTASSPGWYAQVDEVKLRCSGPPPTAVSLASLSATTNSPLPVPAGLPVAALPAVASLALGAAYMLRRKK